MRSAFEPVPEGVHWVRMSIPMAEVRIEAWSDGAFRLTDRETGAVLFERGPQRALRAEMEAGDGPDVS